MKRSVLILLALALFVAPISALALPMMQETISTDAQFGNHNWMYMSRIDFFDQKPDGQHDGYWIGNNDEMEQQLTWSHTLPEGFSVPPYRITKAKLWIDAEWVDETGNVISIQDEWDWDPLNNLQSDNSVYNLTTVNTPGFWNNGTLDISVLASENSIRIDEATFVMDYAYTPEPASFLLVGLGLAGLGAYRRWRKTR